MYNAHRTFNVHASNDDITYNTTMTNHVVKTRIKFNPKSCSMIYIRFFLWEYVSLLSHFLFAQANQLQYANRPCHPFSLIHSQARSPVALVNATHSHALTLIRMYPWCEGARTAFGQGDDDMSENESRRPTTT